MSCLFCLPMYGMWTTSHNCKSLITLLQALEQSNFNYDMTFGADSGVHRCRYYLTDTFMKSDFDRLMFIDADIEFTPEDFGKIWALDADIGVGVYRMRDDEPYAAHVNGKLVDDLDKYQQPMEVDYAGTGFMCIKRSVLEALEPDLPKIKTVKGEIPLWFSFDVVDGVELPEDYNFCHKAREKGFKVMMDPSVRLKHWKQKAM